MGTTRKSNINYIKDNIADVNDSEIDILYDKIIKIVPVKIDNKKGDEIKRLQKILYIESNLKFVENDDLDNLKLIVYESLNHIETNDEKKERIVLEIINKILEANNIAQINKLNEFIRIKRDIILSNETNKVIDDNKEYIFNNGFSKAGCKIYYRNIKTTHFSIIKGILKEIGYDMKSKLGSKTINKIKESFMVYTIIKND